MNKGFYAPRHMQRGGFRPEMARRALARESKYHSRKAIDGEKYSLKHPVPAYLKGVNWGNAGKGAAFGMAAALLIAGLSGFDLDDGNAAGQSDDIWDAPDDLCDPSYPYEEGRLYKINFKRNYELNPPSNFDRYPLRSGGGFGVSQSCERLDENGNIDFYRGIVLHFYEKGTENYEHAENNVLNGFSGVPDNLKITSRFTRKEADIQFPETDDYIFDVIKVQPPERGADYTCALTAMGAATLVGIAGALWRRRQKKKQNRGQSEREVVGHTKEGNPVYEAELKENNPLKDYM